ncbi:MAG TPA: protein kinase [Thermoanaerobaculia bacterium]|nr:protein kinase [Thermoanaerobaculia bacterium]
MDDGNPSTVSGPRPAPEAGSPGIRLFDRGTALGARFEIGEVRGVGGSAVVYSAFDRELKQPVALKVLRGDRTSPEALTRLKREVAVARQAASPRLVRVYDIDAAGESVFLTMEDVAGGSLKERLSQGRLPFEEALRIAREVLEGLAALHGLGIVHRDVKPGNVLLATDGSVKLADFGLARRLEVDETRATSVNAFVGTVDYVSPEQARELDGRSDLYSFGVTLYEMLTGGIPFRRDSAIGTALAHVKDPPPRLRSVRPGAPAWLEAFVARLLAKAPEGRYATAEDALADLRARTATRPPANAARLRRRLLLALGGAALAGGVAFVVLRPAARAPLARIVTRSEGRGIRALDAKGRLLWEREEFGHEANAAAYRAADGAVRVAALESEAKTNTVSAAGVGIQLLDAATGETVGRIVAPYRIAGAFPGMSSRYNVASVDAYDADGDGDDELLVSLNHTELYPGALLLVDPDAETSETLYVSSGHTNILGFVDVDGDGTRELIAGGPANRLGHYTAVGGAVRPPRLRTWPRSSSRAGASPGSRSALLSRRGLASRSSSTPSGGRSGSRDSALRRSRSASTGRSGTSTPGSAPPSGSVSGTTPGCSSSAPRAGRVPGIPPAARHSPRRRSADFSGRATRTSSSGRGGPRGATGSRRARRRRENGSTKR